MDFEYIFVSCKCGIELAATNIEGSQVVCPYCGESWAIKRKAQT